MTDSTTTQQHGECSFLDLVTSAKSTGMGIVELATSFDNLKPDVVLSVADC